MGFRNLGLGTVELKGTRILRAGFSRDAGPGYLPKPKQISYRIVRCVTQSREDVHEASANMIAASTEVRAKEPFRLSLY